MRAQQRLFSVLPLLGLGLLVSHLMAKISCADSALLPERVAKTAQERVDAGAYQTLVFGVFADGKSEVIAFGKLDQGKPPDGDPSMKSVRSRKRSPLRCLPMRCSLRR
jgi:hypothetical protein